MRRTTQQRLIPTEGAWKPSLSLRTVLQSVQLLLQEPNPADGLVVEITEEFVRQRHVFDAKARAMTKLHARETEVEEKGHEGAGNGAVAATAAIDQARSSAAIESPGAAIVNESIDVETDAPALKRRRLSTK